MGYRYIEPNTGREVDVSQRTNGSVTIYLGSEVITTLYSNNVVELQKLAEKYLAEKLDSILSRKDFYQVSWHISFGMSPEHRYTKDPIE